MTHYGIVGSGEHSANMLQDGLKEIYNDDTTLYVYCRTNASPSEKAVYDWLLDHDKNFTAVTSGKSPSVLIETAEYILDGGVAPEMSIIKELAANNGTLLVIWDDTDETRMMDLVFKATGMGLRVLELSNGLAPIMTEDAPEPSKEVEHVVESTEVDIDPLTEDELSDMNISLLKKAAFAQGIADANALSKSELVDKLLGIQEPTVTTSNTHSSTIKFSIKQPAPTHTSPPDYAVIVWHENGMMQFAQVPLSEVKTLLG